MSASNRRMSAPRNDLIWLPPCLVQAESGVLRFGLAGQGAVALESESCPSCCPDARMRT
jgi:hypothetical protein